jgi:hypothetical protein
MWKQIMYKFFTVKPIHLDSNLRFDMELKSPPIMRYL